MVFHPRRFPGLAIGLGLALGALLLALLLILRVSVAPISLVSFLAALLCATLVAAAGLLLLWSFGLWTLSYRLDRNRLAIFWLGSRYDVPPRRIQRLGPGAVPAGSAAPPGYGAHPRSVSRRAAQSSHHVVPLERSQPLADARRRLEPESGPVRLSGLAIRGPAALRAPSLHVWRPALPDADKGRDLPAPLAGAGGAGTQRGPRRPAARKGTGGRGPGVGGGRPSLPF